MLTFLSMCLKMKRRLARAAATPKRVITPRLSLFWNQ